MDRSTSTACSLPSGSFAAAAEPLGTSSGQVSKLVSRLESELSVLIGFHAVTSCNGYREHQIEQSTPDAAA